MVYNVSNMLSPRTGRAVANQFIIEDGNKKIFKSYYSIIATVCGGVVTLDRNYWDYSNTTTKYLGCFLGLSGSGCKELIRKRINQGIYKLSNLNS